MAKHSHYNDYTHQVKSFNCIKAGINIYIGYVANRGHKHVGTAIWSKYGHESNKVQCWVPYFYAVYKRYSCLNIRNHSSIRR